MSEVPFPEGDEFDRMVERHARETLIPGYLREVERWVAKIESDSSDIRNSPDVQPNRRHGGTFVSNLTDLNGIKEHVKRIREKFETGRFLLALSSLEDLKARVAQVNARIAGPAMAAHGRRRANKERHEDAALNHKTWQGDAAVIWANEPSLSKSKVAKRLAERYRTECAAAGAKASSADTIRRHLRKTSAPGKAS
ncbi:MAG: hypothetical protein WAW96_00110 [Alphaproteobacteria bacterium]